MDIPVASPDAPPPGRRWPWAAAAMLVALLPLTPGLSSSRLFYIRDLSLFFWGRYLWLRHAWFEGRVLPLWDPYVGGGQATVPDALHQLFLLPAVLVRLLGNEVLGFNLWVIAPFPLAALGTWLFLARRSSAPAAALGAVAYSLSGPIISTANFPNMSWTVAAMPWMLWATDRLLAQPGRRGMALLAVFVASAAFAGEPVSLVASLLLVSAYAVSIGDVETRALADRVRRSIPVAAAVALGLLLAAVQLLPMAMAAAASDRAHSQTNPLFWSLHPLALLDTVAPKLFGDYFTSQSLASLPWLPILNTGREPFFFSLYLGVPLLAVALLGVLAGGVRRWSVFWVSAGAIALLFAFGVNTPIYPWLRAHVSVLQNFRFPAKYAVVAAMAVAALAAAGWDALVRVAYEPGRPHLRRAARLTAVSTGVVALVAAAVFAACVYLATPTVFRLYAIARALQSANPVGAAEYMLKALPDQALMLCAIAILATGLIVLSTRTGTIPVARHALLIVIAADLVVRAWPVNPTFEAAWMQQPAWMSQLADGSARFYVGGKREGTLDATDPDGSRGYLNPPGLTGSASRAALSGQTAFYPSAWKRREMLSYDLSVLWPAEFDVASRRFLVARPDERDRFLRHTGVRYRVMPRQLAGERTPLAPVPYYVESALYDWGGDFQPRVSIHADATPEPDPTRQLETLFGSGQLVISHAPAAAGRAGEPRSASAGLLDDQAERVRVEAAVDARGGYLLLLDSFDEGWRATVDGQPAEIVRANGLFRAVRLVPGRHEVEFLYRPARVAWSAALSGVMLLIVLGLAAWPAVAVSAAGDTRRSRLSRLGGSALASASTPRP